jgi:hypothetical protein
LVKSPDPQAAAADSANAAVSKEETIPAYFTFFAGLISNELSSR